MSSMKDYFPGCCAAHSKIHDKEVPKTSDPEPEEAASSIEPYLSYKGSHTYYFAILKM